MTVEIKRRLACWSLTIVWSMSAGVLHAADTDGQSSFNGAFLTLSSDIVHDHMALRSFSVTPDTAAAFIEICTHGKHIWINSQAISCLHAEPVENGSAVELEIAEDAIKFAPVGYYLVSAKPTRNAALRRLNELERSTMSKDAVTAASGVRVTTAELSHANAVGEKDRTFVFVAHGKDRDGNRPTYVFSIADSRLVYVGKMPDWPESLTDIGGALQAIVNLRGEALVLQLFSIWPRVETQMFAGEGG